MPRTDLTVTSVPAAYAAAGVAVTMTAADTSNLNSHTLTGRELLIAHNTGASPYTITITSAADPFGRTKDITAESIAAGDIRVYGCGQALLGWLQTDGKLHFQASNAAVKFGILRVP